MKTLEEIRALFVGARNIAKEASPARVDEAAAMLKEISDHCKELYKISKKFIEQAKCRNLYESIDNVIAIMNVRGFCDETVAAFFGLNNVKGPSFADIGQGYGTVKAQDLTQPPQKPSAVSLDHLLPDDEPVPPVATDAADTADEPVSRSALKGKLAPLPPAKPKAVEAPVEPDPSSDKDDTPLNTSDGAPTDDAPAQPVGDHDPADKVDVDEVPATADADSDPDVKDQPSQDDASASKVPSPHLDSWEPQCLDEFIGQTDVVTRLKKNIIAARKKGVNHIDHVMLFGNRGLGKSTLMKLIAKDLGAAYEFIDCTTLRNDVKSQANFTDFILSISKREEPVVIALDEIHALPPRIQQNLLVLLNDRVYNYMQDGTTHCVAMPEFTFIGATTDEDQLLSTLKDRCQNLTFHLKDYTREELNQIFVDKLASMALTIDAKVLETCVNRCRSSIRDITAICRGLETQAIVSETDVISEALAEEYFRERGLDPIGLDRTQRMLLQVIEEDINGVVSGEALAARLNIQFSSLASEFEPYLLKLGFLKIGSRGRSITQVARDYIRYGYYDFGDGVTVGEKPVPVGMAAAKGTVNLNPATKADDAT